LADSACKADALPTELYPQNGGGGGSRTRVQYYLVCSSTRLAIFIESREAQ